MLTRIRITTHEKLKTYLLKYVKQTNLLPDITGSIFLTLYLSFILALNLHLTYLIL